MNKGLLGKISLFSLMLLAAILVLIFVLPTFSVPYTNVDPTVNFTNGSSYSTSNVFLFESNWTNTTKGESLVNDSNTNFTLGRPDGSITVYNLSTTPLLMNNTTILPLRLNITFTQAQLGPAGIYNYSFGVKTNVSTNVTSTIVLNITKASPTLNLTNSSATYPTGTTINGTVATGDAVNSYNISLYRNGTLYNSTTSTSFTFENVTLGVGVWNYTLVYNGTQNYSTSSITNTNFTIITKGTPNVAAFINDLTTNQTVIYPAIATIKGNSSSGGVLPTFNLTIFNITNSSQVFSSNTSKNSPVLISQLLGAGTYNITFNTSGNANWSEAINNTLNLTVSQNSTNPVILTINNVTANYNKQNVTAAYPTSITANCSNVYSSSGSCVLYSDNTSVGTSETVTLGVGTHNYTVTTAGNENYSANATGETYYVIISKGTPNTEVFINENDTKNITISYYTALTIKGNSSSGGILPLFNISIANITAQSQNVLISNTSNSSTILLSPFIGNGTYRINLTYGGNANWSSTFNDTSFLFVNQGTVTPSLSISPSWLATYPTPTTVLCYATSQNNEVITSLFRDGTNYSSTENNTAVTLSVGAYNYVCNYTATANYSSATTNNTLTVNAASTSGSSGGTGTSSSSGNVYITLGVGKANITMTTLTTSGKLIASIAKYQDVAIRGMNITVVNNVVNIKIMITKVNTLPSTVPFDISGKVYHYISVDEANFTDSDISKVNMTFAVNKTWLTANNIDASNMTMYRWANNKWNDLGAIKVSEDTSEVFFTAGSPGLSVFVIGTKGVQAPPPSTVICTESWSCTDWSACANSQQTRTCTDSNNCGTTSSKPIESQSCTLENEVTATPPTSFPLGYVIVIVIAIVVCVLIFLERNNITSYFQKSSKKKTQVVYKKPS